MEMILLAVCLMMAFAIPIVTIWAYRRGVKDGLAQKSDRAPEPMQRPYILQTKAEREKTKADKEALEQERNFMKQINDLANYQPEFTDGN